MIRLINKIPYGQRKLFVLLLSFQVFLLTLIILLGFIVLSGIQDFTGLALLTGAVATAIGTVAGFYYGSNVLSKKVTGEKANG